MKYLICLMFCLIAIMLSFCIEYNSRISEIEKQTDIKIYKMQEKIEAVENTDNSTININWFIELKLKIEAELEECAWNNCVAPKYIINNNRVIKTEKGLKITNQSKDFTILEIYFPNEFNPTSVIICRSYL